MDSMPCFNPPSPCGEGRNPVFLSPEICLFQSTLPVWGGTSQFRNQPTPLFVSIHPPRVGRDAATQARWRQKPNVSIHPPRVGRDPCVLINPGGRLWFQSTLPVWGGTLFIAHLVFHLGVSIHPPRVGRDPAKRWQSPPRPVFQSTLPVWGGTAMDEGWITGFEFQSTLPVWGGTLQVYVENVGNAFQSTLPVWGGTIVVIALTVILWVSIHPPRVGRDLAACIRRWGM